LSFGARWNSGVSRSPFPLGRSSGRLNRGVISIISISSIGEIHQGEVARSLSDLWRLDSFGHVTLERMWAWWFRRQRPDPVVAGVVGRPEIAGVLKPLVEPDFGELVLRPDVISAARVLRFGDRSIGTDHEVNFGGSCDSVVFGVQADDLASSVRLIPVDCDVVIGHRLSFRVDDAAAGRFADAGDDSPPGVNVTFDLFESDIAGRL